jgi:uncharacterized protein with von Willebrand factor type A (vWA) domain
MAEPRASDPLWTLVAFGRELRRRGLPVGTDRIVTFCRCVSILAPADRDAVYWSARSALLGRREDEEAFEAAFEGTFGAVAPSTTFARRSRSPADPVVGPASSDDSVGGPDEAEAVVARPSIRALGAAEDGLGGAAPARVAASELEVLREKSFAEMDDDERRRAARLIRELALRMPSRSSPRLQSASRGSRVDVARTLRRSLRTEGEPFHRAWRATGRRTRPLVVIVDVSGSMAPYSRVMLQFAHAAMSVGRRVEAFCFGTRLTRVTRTLRTRDPDRALRAIGGRVEDWEGGTRIGRALRELLDEWSQRSALRGAVVVVCSDGLERGDPALLGQQMARLRRLAHEVVWVNPLKGSPHYEPLARGMAAALPSVDIFLPGHNLDSLEELSEVLA